MKIHRYLPILVFLLISMSLTGCKGSLYESNKTGYTKITAVEGVTFDMPEIILTQATAITSISKENDYSGSIYLYKNGHNSYLLFDISSILVAVECQTGYNLEDVSDKEDALVSQSLNGIWLSRDTKKFNCDESHSKGAYKVIAEMTADVSITPEVYGMFTGKVAYVSTDSYECTMFVGANVSSRDELSKQQEAIIDHITKSLTIDSDAAAKVADMEDVTVKTTETETQTNPQDIIETETIPQDAPETETDPQTTETLSVEPEYILEETTGTEPTEVTEITEVSEEKESTEEPDVSGGKAESETETEEAKDSYIVRESNQGEVGNGYSDIYHLLSLGMRGRFSAQANDFSSLESSYITITNLYIGQDAIDIIKEYRNSEASMEPYEDAAAGYSWHVVEYELEKSPMDLYVNIKIEGLDGEQLKYRGVGCSSRTYDIFTYMTSDYKKLYCYYMVPNGCTEYMLECGTRITDTSDTACYLISGY